MILDAIAGGVLLASGAMFMMNRNHEAEYVQASSDGNSYLVRKAPDSKLAAEALAELNRRAQTLIRDLARRFPEDRRVQNLRARYSGGVLSEGGDEAGFTSYSVEKERIVMCLRHRDDGQATDLAGGQAGATAKPVLGALEDANTLMYVLLHEMAHLAVDEVGHTDLFWKTFLFLVEAAAGLGLYDTVDYRKKPVSYCGIKISSSVGA